MQFLHRGVFIFFLRGKLALYFFTYFKSLGKWKIELECVFFRISLLMEKEATPLWYFFRISLLVQRNARKEDTPKGR